MKDDLMVGTPMTETALAELFRSQRHGLAGAVRSVLGHSEASSEVLQDAFLRALKALRRGARPADGASWIFVITLNTARDLRRKLQRRRVVEVTLDAGKETGMADPHDSHGPAQRAAAREAADAARAAIAALDDQDKDVFVLRVSGGLSFDATASALGIPIGTAKTRMRRALARLRADLAGFAPDALSPATAGATLPLTHDSRRSER